jgi:hypothetical protein
MPVDLVWSLGIPLPTFTSALPSLGDIILRVVVLHHLVLKKDLSTSLSVAGDQCIDACNKVDRDSNGRKNQSSIYMIESFSSLLLLSPELPASH